MTRLCGRDDLASGEARRFDVDGCPVALVRVGDEFLAIGDTCSHADFSLSEGTVDTDECTIECWKHGSSFSLETGEPDVFPATRPVPVYRAWVDDGEVFVEIADSEGAS